MILKPKHKRPLMKQSGLVFYIIMQIGIRLQIIFFLLFFSKPHPKVVWNQILTGFLKMCPSLDVLLAQMEFQTAHYFTRNSKLKFKSTQSHGTGQGSVMKTGWKIRQEMMEKNGAVEFKEIVESYALWGHRGSLPAFVTITAMYIKVVPLNFLDPGTKCEMRGNVQKHSDI